MRVDCASQGIVGEANFLQVGQLIELHWYCPRELVVTGQNTVARRGINKHTRKAMTRGQEISQKLLPQTKNWTMELRGRKVKVGQQANLRWDGPRKLVMAVL